jgi:tRNA-uridine 2-sulfurtransferase
MANVAVAMSGGVDSSVAALLLKQQGHNVIGVTMKLVEGQLVEGQNEDGSCCSWKTISRAKNTCHLLDIPHYVFNFSEQFQDTVIDDFCIGYANGETPNPCLRCNQYIKFDALLNKIRACGMDYLATGHYAIVENNEQRMTLSRGVDESKNQSYTLYEMTQEQLKHILLPLGKLYKEEVWELAEKHRLPAANAEESVGICFIPNGDYRDFLKNIIPNNPGEIYLASEDRVVGEHNGLHHYTVGQKAGLSCMGQSRLYVIELDTENNRVVIGTRPEMLTEKCVLRNINWVSHTPLKENRRLEGEAEVGYGANPSPAVLRVIANEKASVHLPNNSRPLTPGQSLVLYNEDEEVLVGGTIDSVSN